MVHAIRVQYADPVSNSHKIILMVNEQKVS